MKHHDHMECPELQREGLWGQTKDPMGRHQAPQGPERRLLLGARGRGSVRKAPRLQKAFRTGSLGRSDTRYLAGLRDWAL